MDEQLTNGAATGTPEAAPAEVPALPQGAGDISGLELQPVVAAPAVSGRARRFRWGVALAVVAIVALVTAGGAWVLSGATGPRSLTAAVAPRGTVFFLEIRTDLPGDQRSNLATFMSHFPGFQDRSQFDNALDDTLNKLTGAVSPDLRYTSAFKPWMEGEVSIAVSAPAASSSSGCDNAGTGMSMTSMDDFMADEAAVAIFALKDRAAAQTWLSGELTRQGMTPVESQYAATTLYTFGSAGNRGAYALMAQDLVFGTVAGVKASLDTAKDGSLADSVSYKAAMKQISDDSIARFYVDVKAAVAAGTSSYERLMCVMPGVVAATLPPMDVTSVPDWVAGSMRAENDKLVVEANMPRPAGATGSGNHVSHIASSLPASTIAVFEAHGIGTSLSQGLSALQSAAPSAGIDVSQIDQLQQALGMIGGLEWIRDGSVVITSDGSNMGGGIAIETADASTATSKLGTFRGLLGLAALATGISTKTETYKGSEITVITVPAEVAGEKFDIALATSGDLLLVGYGDSFVKAVMDTTSGTSLAAQADFKAATIAAGDSNMGFAYVNLQALADRVGKAAYSSDPSEWTLYYKPYFDHLGGVAWSVVDGGITTVRLVVTAR
jgi:hypothetical protein